MKAFSIRQPWAYLICHGWKDIENRNWATNYRGRIYIHASKRWDSYPRDFRDLQEIAKDDHDLLDVLVQICGFNKRNISLGAIIGEVDIIDCVTESKSPWFVGKYGFVLANPVFYKNPIPCKGKLRFFELRDKRK